MYRFVSKLIAKHKHTEHPSFQRLFKYAHLTLPRSLLKACIRSGTAECFLQVFYTSNFNFSF